MFREDLTPKAAHYSMLMTGSNGIANNYRSARGKETVHVQTSLFVPDPGVWFRIVKSADVFATYYKPADSKYWYQFGARLSLPRIDHDGAYYVGVAVSSHGSSNVATATVGSIQLTRNCPSTTDPFECDQASNCEAGQVTGACYSKGERPEWESKEATTSILDIGSTTESVGCVRGGDFDANYLIDETTRPFECEQTSAWSSVIVHPTHGRQAMAKALRIYGKYSNSIILLELFFRDSIHPLQRTVTVPSAILWFLS